MLEFHGILVLEDEATNEIILKVAHLVDPEHLLQDDDISIRHPLPSREGAIPPIIVKFCRRNMRDRIYNARRELSTKTAQDLAFPHNNKLYINESLTPKLRELLYKVKTFKRNNQFKFVWTRNGNWKCSSEKTTIQPPKSNLSQSWISSLCSKTVMLLLTKNEFTNTAKYYFMTILYA